MSQQLPVTFGRTKASVEVGGFRVTEAAYAANAKVSRHEHEFPSWTAVLAGGFQERFRKTEFSCRTGTLLAKPASAAHSNEYGESGARVVIVELRKLAIDTHPQLSPTTGSEVRMLPASAVRSRVARLHAALNGGVDESLLAVHAAILDLGLLLLRSQPRESSRVRWLERAVDRLQSEFVHPPSLTALAAECGVHPVHLCAAFRSAKGCSPGEFVRRLRIDHARGMLATTKDSVALIAFALGFSDQSHLTRQFRAATGMTPGQFRRRHTFSHDRSS
jgi:AraC family transcriptional regulator